MREGEARAGNARVVQPQVVVVLYRRDDGGIVSTHYFAAAAGVELPGPEELEAAAFAQAASDGLGDKGALAAIHVRPEQIERGKAYRIDPKTGALEEAKPGAAEAEADPVPNWGTTYEDN